MKQVKLSPAQKAALQDAEKLGCIYSTKKPGLRGYHGGRTVWWLVDKGLLDWHGGDNKHFTITEDGRWAIGVTTAVANVCAEATRDA